MTLLPRDGHWRMETASEIFHVSLKPNGEIGEDLTLPERDLMEERAEGRQEGRSEGGHQ